MSIQKNKSITAHIVGFIVLLTIVGGTIWLADQVLNMLK